MLYSIKPTDSTIQVSLRQQMLDIFRKMSDNDLIHMYNILNQLDLVGFAMSFCLEILEERGYNVYNLPKQVSKN